MISNVISCPNCREQVSITDAFRSEIEATYKSKLDSELQNQKDEMANDFVKKVAVEREKIRSAIKEENLVEFEDLKIQLIEQRNSIELSKKRELELMKKSRELELEKKNSDLEVQRKVDEEIERIRFESAKKSDEENRLKILEKDKQIDDFKKQVDEWRKKAEQGSQKMQGEVIEIEVERELKEAFQFDSIEPISSGTRGADIVQFVMTKTGTCSGKILWEVKNTKLFSDSWIKKLKDDQRSSNSDLAVLVTQSMPKGRSGLVYMDGVWVTDFYTYVGVACALRLGLLQAFQARIASANKDEKKDAIYEYLVGLQFRQRVEAVTETFGQMRNDLEREKRATYKNWATREQQITRMISSTSGMYGDICGIVGTALPRIALLELNDEEHSDVSVEK